MWSLFLFCCRSKRSLAWGQAFLWHGILISWDCYHPFLDSSFITLFQCRECCRYTTYYCSLLQRRKYCCIIIEWLRLWSTWNNFQYIQLCLSLGQGCYYFRYAQYRNYCLCYSLWSSRLSCHVASFLLGERKRFYSGTLLYPILFPELIKFPSSNRSSPIVILKIRWTKGPVRSSLTKTFLKILGTSCKGAAATAHYSTRAAKWIWWNFSKHGARCWFWTKTLHRRLGSPLVS